MTETLNNSSGYQKSLLIYDALLRPRQTQSTTPQAGRLITDTYYDTRGWTRASYNGWWDDSTAPTLGAPVSAADLGKQVPNQTLNTYDGLGRAVVVTAAKNGVAVSATTTVYQGDRTTIVPPAGGVTQTTLIDPLGRTKELHEYTAPPSVTTPNDVFTGSFAVTGGTASVSKFGHDGHGNQSSFTDALNNTWTTEFDLMGRATKKSDPDAGTLTGLIYDGNGNLLQSTDSRGKSTSVTFDKLNRRVGQYAATVSEQSSSNQVNAWVYDNSNNAVENMTYPIGQLTTSISYKGGKAYTKQQNGFNVFGKSLGETITIPDSEGALAGSYVFGHTYTSVLGLPLTDSYPAKGALPSETVLHGYSGVLDLPTTLGGSAGYSNGVSYDAWGRVNQATVGSGSNLAYITNTYDVHTSQLTNQIVTRSSGTPTIVDEQSYRYDLTGNVTKQVSKRLGANTPSETQCYLYDKLRRMTEAWTATDDCATAPSTSNKAMVGNNVGGGSAYWTSWSTDPIGNRTNQIERGIGGATDKVTTYSYGGTDGDQPHTLTSTTTTGGATSSTSYGYDSAGNMTMRNAEKGRQSLDWNELGQLAVVTSTAGQSSFIYDADGNILLQKDPGKVVLYLPGQQLALDTATQAVTGNRYFNLPGGGTAVRSGSGSNYSFEIGDSHGSPSLYLDNTAQSAKWRQYTPFGAARGPADVYPDNRGFLNKVVNNATGLIQVGARSYDASVGRFISRDAVLDMGNPQQMNGYAYSSNNPVNFSDPSGNIQVGDDRGLLVAVPNADGTETIVDNRPKKCRTRYCFGAPKNPYKPAATRYPYNPKEKATAKDYWNWNLYRWLRMGAAAVSNPLLSPVDLTDGVATYNHYRDASGTDFEIDYEKAYGQDAVIRRNVDAEIAEAQSFAESLLAECACDSLSMTGEDKGIEGYPESENWQKALGDHNVWGSAKVARKGEKVTMTITVHAADFYDFNPNNKDVRSGLSDDDNGRFATLGWAKPFLTQGSLTRTVTWVPGGSPSDSTITGGARR
ncbi:RHS repeat-associated core domain-containing protein [Micromonospora sp. NPDC005171]|uniref:RHS repeat-associated core domain-containing protein n=1 Tax=Micromonospora sp. NPDC005171 TaxID=3156866 RepID=UPI0033B828B7